jgi:hypothetical protein
LDGLSAHILFPYRKQPTCELMIHEKEAILIIVGAKNEDTKEKYPLLLYM